MQHLIKRLRLIKQILLCIKESPVTVILGARQTGKTTLARMVAKEFKRKEIFDLEEAASRRALENPDAVLDGCRGLVIIDEIQRMPSLFEVLRPLCDRRPNPAKFLVLGSASFSLIKGISESLAGRALFVKISGFSVDETGPEQINKLWIKGGFPRSYLSAGAGASHRWLEAFITTFLERDIPQLGIRVPSETLRRFWMMLAHYHGQILNFCELARSMDVTPNTVRHYIDILNGSFMVRVLPPWYENIKKRQIKAPKIYIRDSGILHYLLGIQTMRQLYSNPRYGSSWEGFAMEQILNIYGEQNAYFWSTQRGAELDLMFIRKNKKYGFEFKSSQAPSMTRSMHIALEDLQLESLRVIYPGAKTYKIHKKVEILSLNAVQNSRHLLF